MLKDGLASTKGAERRSNTNTFCLSKNGNKKKKALTKIYSPIFLFGIKLSLAKGKSINSPCGTTANLQT